MKTQLIKTLTIFLLMLPATIMAQSEFDKLYEKYAGKDGITSINIQPELFKFLGSIDMSDSAEDSQEVQEIMAKLSGLKILAYEGTDTKTMEKFFNEVKKTLPMNKYAELMSVDDSDSHVKFLVKKKTDNTFSEMLMIVKSDDEVLVMSMLGDLDMKSISKIGSSLDMEGMENLEKLDK